MSLDPVLFAYDAWPSGEPYTWPPNGRGTHPDDQLDFHVDLGCGTQKKGRIGVDHYPAPGVNVVCDFDAPGAGRDPRLGTLRPGVATYARPEHAGGDARALSRHDQQFVICRGLPFLTDSIRSIVTHHALEHVGDGFIPLIEEVYRVLVPGGIFRIIVPLFPSWSAVSDPDHRRYFMAAAEGGFSTFDSFCGTPGDEPHQCFLGSFSVPYSTARFHKTHQTITPRSKDPEVWWTPQDSREMRVTLVKQT